MRYILFHKPYGVLSQFTPAGNWRTLAEFGLPLGVYAAGRLDADSEGLLLLTDDGRMIADLLRPGSRHGKRYHIQVEHVPAMATLERLTSGVIIQGRRTLPCEVRLLDPPPDYPARVPPIRARQTVPTAWIEMRLFEGRNRQVRRMTAIVGHPTLRLIRVAIGSLELGSLEPGTWHEVLPADARKALAGRSRF